MSLVQRAHRGHEADQTCGASRRDPRSQVGNGLDIVPTAIGLRSGTRRSSTATAGNALRARPRRSPRRGLHRLRESRVLFHEGGDEAIEKPQHVVAHEHLAVAVGTSTDADRRNLRRAVAVRATSAGITPARWRTPPRPASAIASSIRASPSSGELPVSRSRRAGAPTAGAVRVAHHRNTDVDEPANGVEHRPAALELHRAGATFL